MFPRVSLILILVSILVKGHRTYSIPDPLEEVHGKIVYVTTFFRHGDRTIMNPYPNDPYANASLWPEGFAQLTKAGKRRALELGKWMRKRYGHLIGDQPYSADLLCVNSTNIDRSLMSAELFLAGFFPPSEDEIWSEDEFRHWQPIPVHPLPPFLDNVVATEATCEKYNLEVAILSKSPKYAALYERNRDLFEHVSKYSGRPMSQENVFKAIQFMINVYTCLQIEEDRGLPLPAWTKNYYPEPMKSMAEFSFSAYTETFEMKRFTGGPILQLLIADIKQKLADDKSRKVLQFFSGHDTTISALMNTLGIFDGFQPPFSAALIFELRRKGDQHVVTVFYRNSTQVGPHMLKVPACGDPCTLDTFIESTASLIPNDWEEECSTL